MRVDAPGGPSYLCSPMTHLLDTLQRAPYKPRPLLLSGLVIGLLFLGSAASAEQVLGVQLPDSVKKVGENRYRASQSYEDTLKYYRSVYPPARFGWKPVVNQPGVKAVHISMGPGKKAEGINIYEANEEVRLYVVPGVVQKPAKAAPKKSTRPSKRK